MDKQSNYRRNIFPPAEVGWRLFVALITLYTVYRIPVDLAMGADVGFHVRVFDSILLTVFIIDPVVGYLFARVRGPHGTKRYVQKFLPLGIISALGLIVISPDSPFRLLALVKLIESTAFVSAWRHQLLHRGNAIRLFLFVYWMAVLIHLVACGWYELRTATHIPSEHAYLESVYWAVTTLATIGYGDITPSSPAQMQYAIAVMLLGFVMMGYLVGNIAGVLNKHDPLRAQYTSALDEVSAFAAYHGLPTNLKHRIIDYYWYMWQQGAAFSTSVVLDNLPSGIRSEIMLYLKRDVLSRVPFFKEASETFLREIATVMEPVVVTPGEFVFHIGDPATHMFFVSRGTLDVLDGTGSAIGKLSSGDFFGEMALLERTRRMAGVKALEYCDLYQLDARTLDRIIKTYPHFEVYLQSVAAERSELAKRLSDNGSVT